MKYYGITGFIFFALIIASTGFIACDDADEIDENITVVLTEEEKSHLLFMREEEKLARDVYIYLDDEYSMNIFSNISSSEQTHMDEVLNIMEVYGLEDPASNEVGVFTNETLQELYNDLIALGDKSLVDAMKVGATIEDVDIRDLDDALADTNKPDISNLFEILKCGSRNHMRAFVGQLDWNDETYTPQFITEEQYNEILNGAHESCRK
jgi:hypothetical protein